MSYFNPEFQRNLWLELSPHKLIATPLIITAILYLGYLIGNEWVGVVHWAVWLFALTTIVYGAYTAGDSLSDEIQEHTWPLQRLTAISPWTMTWGKVFGGTIFAWYMGACSLLAIILVHLLGFEIDEQLVIHAKPLQSILYLLGIAVLFQAFGLLFSLLHLQKTHDNIKRTIIVPVLGMFFAFWYIPSLLHKLSPHHAQVIWYHLAFPKMTFTIISLYINAAWMLCGAYRLMRDELQCRNTIGLWLAFLLYQILYFIGFTFSPDITNFQGVDVFDRTLDLPILSLRAGIAFTVCYTFTYVMAAIEHVHVIELRNALRCQLTGKWKLIFDVAPRWVPTMLLTAALAIVLLLFIYYENYYELSMASLVFAMLLFMLRDIGLFTLFDITGKRRHVTTAAVYLVLLYVVIPAILKLLHLSFLLPWFYPRPDYNLFYALFAPGLQAALVWIMVNREFQARCL